MKITRIGSIILTTLFVSRSSTAIARGQVRSQDSISPAKLHAYLRQPGGLEKLSGEVGDVTFTDPEERWGEHDLRSLTKGSDVIATVVVQNSTSRLSEDGDCVLTQYKLQIVHVLKGTAPSIIQLDATGGTVRLSNGHYAAWHTQASDGLLNGQTYVLFLRRSSDTFSLVSGGQGMLQISKDSSSVHLVDRNPSHDALLRNDLESSPLFDAEEKIRIASRQ